MESYKIIIEQIKSDAESDEAPDVGHNNERS